MTYEKAKTAPLPILLGYIASIYEDFECPCHCFKEAWTYDYFSKREAEKFAKKQLDKCRAIGQADRCLERLAFQRVLEAVEKQTPKKPIPITQNEHTTKIIGYGCPNCKKDVIGSGFYCWNCGQRLDWCNDL